MKIIQVNVDRGKAAFDLLHSTCREKCIDIAIVAEPNKKMASRGHWVMDSNMDAAIRVFSRDVNILKYDTEQKGFVWIELDDLVVYSCYASPNISEQDFESYLQALGESLKMQKKQVVVAGDLNAKSRVWGPKEDRKGKALMDWIAQFSLVVQNRGEEPTFVRRGSESHIDITLTSEEIADRITEWKVAEEENLSCHRNIYYSINSDNTRTTQTNEARWRINEERIPIFVENLEKEMGKILKLDIKEGMKAINRALESTFNKSAAGGKRSPVYWWNNNIAQLRKECLCSRRILTRGNKCKEVTEESRERLRSEYNEKRKALKNAIIGAKQEAWKKTCQEVDQDIWGMGYKIVYKKLNTMPRIKLNNEKLMETINELFPTRGENNWPYIAIEEKGIPYFTETELLEASKRIRNGKSPGPDQIPPEVIKAAIRHFPREFLEIMNGQLKRGVFPKTWKIAKLVLIQKPKKAGDMEAKYRPICLLDVMGKVLEQLIAVRITGEVEPKLSKNQYGFRKKRSTIDAMRRIMESVQSIKAKAHQNRKHAVLVTLDIKNAFNSAPWDGIMEALKKFGVSEYLIRIIGSYLEDRWITVEGKQIRVTCGVPQGSVLGPLLWNILYDEVLRIKLPEGATIIGFADDTAIIVEAKTKELLETHTNTALCRIENILEKKQLQLAPEKTEAIVLYGGRKLKEITLEVGRTAIQSKECLRYLGLHIARNSNMKQHVTQTAKKSEEKLMTLSRLMPNLKGPKASKRRVLASVVHSVMLYAAPIWGEEMRHKKYRSMLTGVQRRVAIRVGSAYRTISAEAVQVITGIVPLALMVEEREKMYMDREVKRQELRAEIMQKWQKEWEKDTQKAGWTKTLIKNIGTWVNRKHGEVDYFLTQFLGGHGCFGSYLKRFKKRDTDMCWYCGQVDTPEHTFFMCDRWATPRQVVRTTTGTILTPDNIVNIMLEKEGYWNAVRAFATEILKTKEVDVNTKT